MEQTLELTQTEVNQILEYLGSRPYKEVYPLIQMIQLKWAEQLKAKENQN